MTVVCITGTNKESLDRLFNVFCSKGLEVSNSLERGNQTISIGDWHRLAKAQLDEGASVGRMYDQLATDLFVENMALNGWGWSDTQSLQFLDYWQGFDKSIKFILVCESPKSYFQSALLEEVIDFNKNDLVEAWYSDHKKMLDFYVQNCHRAIMLDSADVFEKFDESLRLFKEEWRLPLSASDDVSCESDVSSYTGDSGLKFVSELLIHDLLERCESQYGAFYKELLAAQFGTDHDAINNNFGLTASDISFNEYAKAFTQLYQKLQTMDEQAAQLQAALRNQSQLEELRKREEEYIADQSVLNAQLRQVKSEREKMQEKVEAEVSRSELLQKQENLLFQKLVLLEREKIAIEADCDREMKKVRSQSKAEVSLLEYEKNSLQESFEKETQELKSKFQEKYLLLERGKAKKEEQYSRLKSEYESLVAERARFEQKVENDKALLVTELTQAKFEVDNLLAENKKFTEERIDSVQKLKDYEELLNAELTKSQLELEKLRVENKRIKKESNELTGQNDLLKKNVDEKNLISSQLTQFQLEVDKVSKENCRLIKELEEISLEKNKLKFDGFIFDACDVSKHDSNYIYSTFSGIEAGCFKGDLELKVGFNLFSAHATLSRLKEDKHAPSEIFDKAFSVSSKDLSSCDNFSAIENKVFIALIRYLSQHATENSLISARQANRLKNLGAAIDTLGRLSYSELKLVSETVNPDYENLCLELKDIKFAGNSYKALRFKLSCANVRPGRFGAEPKLEFPAETNNIFEGWYAESVDNDGEKLELRFAAPAAMDMQVWSKLPIHDQKLIVLLIKELPFLVKKLVKPNLYVSRNIRDWENMADTLKQIFFSKVK